MKERNRKKAIKKRKKIEERNSQMFATPTPDEAYPFNLCDTPKYDLLL